MVWMDLTGATGTANTPTPTPTGGVGVFTPTPTATSWPATTMTCANMTGLVTLDGDLKEWDGVEQITVNKDTSAVVTPLPGPLASDAQARVKCGWDADYLYVAAVLDDDDSGALGGGAVVFDAGGDSAAGGAAGRGCVAFPGVLLSGREWEYGHPVGRGDAAAAGGQQ